MKFTLSVCLLLIQLQLRAQHVLQSDTSSNGQVNYIQLDVKQRPVAAADAYGFMKSALKLTADDTLRPVRNITGSNGRNHRLFQQYYKGYKVAEGTYAVHEKDGLIEAANGKVATVGKVSLDVSIDETTALTTALGTVNAVKYGWQDPDAVARYREVNHDPNASLYPKGELLIVKDDSITHKYRLAYKFFVSALQPYQELEIYVDAGTGRVFKKVSLIMHTNVAGGVQTLYSGYNAITMDNYGTNLYRLQETRTTNGKTAAIQTFNMNNGTAYTNTDFTGTTQYWYTAEAGNDVHWGTEKVFDYWASIRNWNSFDNSGTALQGYVHANLIGMGYGNNDNAFWSSAYRRMTYGDGTTSFKAVVSLDVVAHEIAHGITQYTAVLNGGGETGALNEGLSDIWAATIKSWSNTYKSTWTIGDEIMKNGQPCLRNMQNPKQVGYPDTYHGTNWDYNNEVHKNSTVFSHWFYLLSQGGSGTNDLGNAYGVLGQGITVASDIVWNAQSTLKLQANSTYADARTAMVAAATELYGTGSCQVKAVIDAWYAVGVGTPFTTISLSISGSNAFCGTTTYTVSGVPAGQTVTWSVSPAGIVNVVPSGNSVSLTKVTQGNFTLTASLPNCILATKAVTTVISMGLSSSQNGTCRSGWQDWLITTSPNMPLTNYNWTSNASSGSTINIYSPSGGSSYVSVYGGGGITITAKNACGENIQDGVTVYSPCPRTLLFNVSPNPAVNNIMVSQHTDQALAKANNAQARINVISIYDQMGNRVRQQKYTGVNTAQLNVGGLRSGMYYIEIEYDNTKERQPLLIGQR